MTFGRPDTQQQAEFSSRMRRRYATLREDALEALRHVRDPRCAALAVQADDPKEEAMEDLINDVHLAGVVRDLAEMRDIERTLARMHAGTFGSCMDCGRQIPASRLQDYPTAKRCRTCQETHESKLE